MNFKKISIFLLIIALCFLASYPLLNKGFFPTDDGEKLIIRWASYHQSLKDGQLFPRWAGNLYHGFGYPVFIFLYPGLLLCWEIIYFLFRLNFQDTVKLFIAISFPISSIFMYLFLKNYFKKMPALAGGIVYSFSPYRFFDAYSRGSFGEVLSFVLAPLLFFNLAKFFKTKDRRWFIGSVVSWFLLIISHNVSAIIFSLLAVLFIGFNFLKTKDRQIALYGFLIVALSFLSSAFFLLPAFFERNFTKFNLIQVSQYQGYFPVFWEFLFARNYLGIFYIVIIIFSLILLFRKSKHKMLSAFFILIFFVSLLLNFASSDFLWQFFELGRYVQFPFRFLSLTTFCLAFIIAAFVNSFSKSKFLGVLFIILAIVFSYWYIKPNSFYVKDNLYYLTNLDSTTSADEYLPIWVKLPPEKMFEQKIEIDGSFVLSANKSNLITAQIKSNTEQNIVINTFYYPGWEVFNNNEKLELLYQSDEMGRLVFKLPEGDYIIQAKFKNTLLRTISNLTTILTLLFLLFWFLYLSFKVKKYKI